MSYDAWKLESPEEESDRLYGPWCEFCECHIPRGANYQPDCCTGACGTRWRDPDADYEAMRDDR